MHRTRLGLSNPASLVGLLCLAMAVPSQLSAQASRTRPSGGGGTVRASGSSSGGAIRVSGSAGYGAVRASGRATYGYGGGWYRPYYPYYGGGWGYGWGWGWGWGWPYYSAAYAYRPYTTVSVRPGSAPGTVQTKVKPKKATVTVDGENWGQARDYNGSWDLLYLPPGSREVEFSHPGYQTLRVHLDVRPGGYYRVDEILQKGEGLDPRSTEPPPAKAVVDQARSSSGPPPSRPQAAPPLAEVQGMPRSSIQKGFLSLRAWPDDAAVYLDGQFLAEAGELGRLHGALPVAAGIHRIEVVRPGYGGETIEVDVAAGATEKIDVRLPPE